MILDSNFWIPDSDVQAVVVPSSSPLGTETGSPNKPTSFPGIFSALPLLGGEKPWERGC